MTMGVAVAVIVVVTINDTSGLITVLLHPVVGMFGRLGDGIEQKV